jgi:hypothetical protein
MDLLTWTLGGIQAVGLGFSGWLHHRSVDHGERIAKTETKVGEHDRTLAERHTETTGRFDRIEAKLDRLIEREIGR